MSPFTRLFNWGSVVQPTAANAPGGPGDPAEFAYISRQSLTFTGVNAGAGIIATLIAAAVGKDVPNLLISGVIGVVVGGFLVWIGIAEASPAVRAKPAWLPKTLLYAVLNVGLLIASIQGIGQMVSPETTTTTTTTSTTTTSTTTTSTTTTSTTTATTPANPTPATSAGATSTPPATR